jgi:hypothetical protein
MRYNAGVNRTVRTVIGAFALLLLVVGTAFAVSNPVALNHRSPVAASHDPTASPAASAKTEEPEDGDESEEADEADGAPASPELVARMLQRLTDAGMDTDASTLATLIDTYGVGGAVRLLAWSDASGSAVADLQQLRDGGMGWGQIARQLNADSSLQLSPGIGWVMSGGHGKGHDKSNAATDAANDGRLNGRDSAPGQNRD